MNERLEKKSSFDIQTMELWKCLVPFLLLPVACISQNFVTLIGCNSTAQFDILENQISAITCQSNIDYPGEDIYWSLTYPTNNDIEVRIGQCGCSLLYCSNCNAVNTNFSITTDSGRNTRLQFLNNQQDINGAVVKCSTFGNTSQANCSLRFIKVYNMSTCGSQGLVMEENSAVIVTCDRPDSSQSTVWQISYANGTVQNVTGCVDCSHSSPSDKPCYCDQHIGAIDYSYMWVERVDSDLDHTALKCFQKNNTYSECEIRVQSYNLINCDEDRVLEVVRESNTPLLCKGLSSNDGMHWTLTNTSGRTIRIASCDALNDNADEILSCQNSSSNFNVSRNATVSQLTFVESVMDLDNTTIACVGRYNNLRDSCRLRVIYYQLDHCENDYILVPNEANSSIRCEGLLSSESIYWTISDSSNQTRVIANCSAYNDSTHNISSCTSSDKSFTVSRTGSNSRLIIVNNNGGETYTTVGCWREDGLLNATCQLRVVFPATIENASVALDSNLTLTASVNIVRIFPPTNTCLWYITVAQENATLNSSTYLNLTSFTEEDLEYYHGTCDLIMPLNVTEGTYNVALNVSKEYGPETIGSVVIERTGNLSLSQSSCPSYIAEGASVNCECRHLGNKTGSPTARVFWINHTSESPLLNISNIHRNQTDTEYTCQSVWGPEEDVAMVIYTLMVAYGPRSAVITGPSNLTGNEQSVKLNCTTNETFPSANFSWSPFCQIVNSSSNVSTCSFRLDQLKDVEVVVCTAFNSKIPALTANDSFIIPLFGSGEQAEPAEVAFPLAAVAGGVAAGLVVVIIIIIVVCVVRYRRRKKESSGRNDFPQCSNNTNDIKISESIYENSTKAIPLQITYNHLGQSTNQQPESQRLPQKKIKKEDRKQIDSCQQTKEEESFAASQPDPLQFDTERKIKFTASTVANSQYHKLEGASRPDTYDHFHFGQVMKSANSGNTESQKKQSNTRLFMQVGRNPMRENVKEKVKTQPKQTAGKNFISEDVEFTNSLYEGTSIKGVNRNNDLYPDKLTPAANKASSGVRKPALKNEAKTNSTQTNVDKDLVKVGSDSATTKPMGHSQEQANVALNKKDDKKKPGIPKAVVPSVLAGVSIQQQMKQPKLDKKGTQDSTQNEDIAEDVEFINDLYDSMDEKQVPQNKSSAPTGRKAVKADDQKPKDQQPNAAVPAESGSYYDCIDEDQMLQSQERLPIKSSPRMGKIPLVLQSSAQTQKISGRRNNQESKDNTQHNIAEDAEFSNELYESADRHKPFTTQTSSSDKNTKDDGRQEPSVQKTQKPKVGQMPASVSGQTQKKETTSDNQSVGRTTQPSVPVDADFITKSYESADELGHHTTKAYGGHVPVGAPVQPQTKETMKDNGKARSAPQRHVSEDAEFINQMYESTDQLSPNSTQTSTSAKNPSDDRQQASADQRAQKPASGAMPSAKSSQVQKKHTVGEKQNARSTPQPNVPEDEEFINQVYESGEEIRPLGTSQKISSSDKNPRADHPQLPPDQKPQKPHALNALVVTPSQTLTKPIKGDNQRLNINSQQHLPVVNPSTDRQQLPSDQKPLVAKKPAKTPIQSQREPAKKENCSVKVTSNHSSAADADIHKERSSDGNAHITINEHVTDKYLPQGSASRSADHQKQSTERISENNPPIRKSRNFADPDQAKIMADLVEEIKETISKKDNLKDDQMSATYKFPDLNDPLAQLQQESPPANEQETQDRDRDSSIYTDCASSHAANRTSNVSSQSFSIDLLQTTNSGDTESDCVEFINDLYESADSFKEVFERKEDRPSTAKQPALTSASDKQPGQNVEDATTPEVNANARDATTPEVNANARDTLMVDDMVQSEKPTGPRSGDYTDCYSPATMEAYLINDSSQNSSNS